MGNMPCKCLNTTDGAMNCGPLDKDAADSESRRKLKAYRLSTSDLQKYNMNMKKIVAIQSWIRGFRVRKKEKEPFEDKQKSIRDYTRESAQLSDEKQQGTELKFIPDYSNPETRAMEKKLGSFKYQKQLAKPLCNLEQRGPIECRKIIYIGQWTKAGVKCGKGVKIWPDGMKYEGYWENNKANGNGRLIYADGEAYEGNWLNDKCDGYGVYKHLDGSEYAGTWKNDKQHGFGVETWADAAKYEGHYENGKKNGNGKFMWSDGSSYEGSFKDNCLHGVGKYVWADKRSYEGEWRSNKMSGKGKYTWPEGRTYNGEFLNDKRHGYGEMWWPNGQKYAGGWSMGKQDGKGTLTTPEGAMSEGVWKAGKRVDSSKDNI